MKLENVIEITTPLPDSQYRLAPCKQCKSDNVAYVRYNAENGEAWRVECFDCGHTVDNGDKVRHDVQLTWNKENKMLGAIYRVDRKGA